MNSYHKTGEQITAEESEIRAAQADPDKFAVLYERYYKAIFVFIFRRTGDDSLTADIVSVVFLKAMINLKTFKFRGVPFSAWLFRIAFNEINMYFRKTKKERIVSLNDQGIHSLSGETTEGYEEEKRMMVASALSKLPEESLHLIELRFFEDRPFSEIGMILGITENNAKVKTYRILDKLKSILKGRI